MEIVAVIIGVILGILGRFGILRSPLILPILAALVFGGFAVMAALAPREGAIDIGRILAVVCVYGGGFMMVLVVSGVAAFLIAGLLFRRIPPVPSRSPDGL